MAGFKLARLLLDSPITWTEQLGDPVTNTGGAPVPAIRSAIRHSVDLPTFTDPVSEDGLERRLRARRQIRALLNNAPYKMSGLFLTWEDDPEQEGWYIPDQGQMAQGAPSPLTHGWFDLENFAWFKVGAPRTHRDGVLLSIKDLRTGLTARDTLRRVYSEDFAALNALALTALPAAVSDIANTVSLTPVPAILLPAGRDQGQTGLVTEQADLTVLSYEVAQASRNLGDVVVYDQKGLAGLPEGTAVNLVLNPSLEYGEASMSTAHTVGIASKARSLNGPAVGKYCMEGVTAATANQGLAFMLGEVPAGSYTCQARIRGTPSAKLEVFADNLANEASAVQVITLPASSEAYITVTWEWTTKATSTEPCIVFRHGPASVVQFFVDAVMCIPGKSLTTYIDGDTPGYDWDGTPGDSVTIPEPQQFGWEEIYGPDYPYTAGAVPVLENGRCRVRYDPGEFPTTFPGWIIDVWTGIGWEEQGKFTPGTAETTVGPVVLESVSLREYSPSRAVIATVITRPEIAQREEVFITLQRGWSGPRFEIYATPNTGDLSIAQGIWTVAVVDTDNSFAIIGIPGSGGPLSATAKGTGHTGLFPLEDAGEFTTSNYAALGRWGKPFGVTFAVLQANIIEASLEATSYAYSTERNRVGFQGAITSGIGYCSVQIGFPVQQTQQALEAEAMKLETGTASTTDATASGGKAATATRTSDANAHVTQVAWPNGEKGTYRVYVRLKTSAKAAKVKFYVKTSTTKGVTQETNGTVASESYEWYDLGEVVTTNGIMEIHAWLSAAGTLSVDRVEAFCVASSIYDGAQDLGQAVLMDSRVTSTVVTRR